MGEETSPALLSCPVFGSSLFLSSPQLWLMAVSVCLVFTVTIGVFPSVTAKVHTSLGEGNEWGKCGQAWRARRKLATS